MTESFYPAKFYVCALEIVTLITDSQILSQFSAALEMAQNPDLPWSFKPGKQSVYLLPEFCFFMGVINFFKCHLFICGIAFTIVFL